MSREDALSKAQSSELDLLLISETSTPPVCKLVNYGQFMYQQKKKEKSARKSAQVTKELKMSPKISENDYQVRLNKAKVFLSKRYKINLSGSIEVSASDIDKVKGMLPGLKIK